MIDSFQRSAKADIQKSSKPVCRRDFLKMTGLTTGGFVLGSMLPMSLPAWAHGNAPHDNTLNLFVAIETNGRVNIVCHRKVGL
jgi:isoquinoline 1-oxidoreductase beta subunit